MTDRIIPRRFPREPAGAKPKLIGMVGYKGSGKSTACGGIPRHQVCSLATPLKNMLAALGVGHEYLHGTSEQKEQPLELLGGKSARHAMQTLGTEWGRNMISDTLWLDSWWLRTQTYLAGTLWKFVVVDDVRFVNEANYLRNKGATIIRIVRPGCFGDGHPSETEQRDIVADATFYNNSTPEALQEQVRGHFCDY